MVIVIFLLQAVLVVAALRIFYLSSLYRVSGEPTFKQQWLEDERLNQSSDRSEIIACDPSIVNSAKRIDRLRRKMAFGHDHQERMSYRQQIAEESHHLVAKILSFKLKDQQASLNDDKVVILAQRRSTNEDEQC